MRKITRNFFCGLAALMVLALAGPVPSAFATTDWRASYEKNTACAGGVAANDYGSAQSDGNAHCVTIEFSGSPTYDYGAFGYTAYATPTDTVCILGSATKVVRVTAFTLLVQSTSATLGTWNLVRRSAADTGGTNVLLTPVKRDSTNAAATATLLWYTAAPTLGTTVGTEVSDMIATTALTAAPAKVDMTNGSTVSAGGPTVVPQSYVLRGTSEELCWNFAGAALPSGFTAGIAAQWAESAN